MAKEARKGKDDVRALGADRISSNLTQEVGRVLALQLAQAISSEGSASADEDEGMQNLKSKRWTKRTNKAHLLDIMQVESLRERRKAKTEGGDRQDRKKNYLISRRTIKVPALQAAQSVPSENQETCEGDMWRTMDQMRGSGGTRNKGNEASAANDRASSSHKGASDIAPWKAQDQAHDCRMHVRIKRTAGHKRRKPAKLNCRCHKIDTGAANKREVQDTNDECWH